jgi:hypothetical protein
MKYTGWSQSDFNVQGEKDRSTREKIGPDWLPARTVVT